MASCCDPYEDRYEERWRRGALSTLTCGTAWLAGFALASLGMPEASLALLLLAYVAGGWEASGRAFAAVRQATRDVDLLMLLAAAGAGVVGHWLEGAALLFLFSLGNSLENYAFGRTRRSIRALMELRPDEVSRVDVGDLQAQDPGGDRPLAGGGEATRPGAEPESSHTSASPSSSPCVWPCW